MKNPLNNLPPFYVGQKVVGVNPNRDGLPVVGKIYTVDYCKRCFCGCGNWVVNVGDKTPFARVKCLISGKIGDHEYCLLASRFAPIQQTNFPLMSFTEIVKKEETEILINN